MEVANYWTSTDGIQLLAEWASLEYSFVTGNQPQGLQFGVRFPPTDCYLFYVGSLAPSVVQGLLENPTATVAVFSGTPFEARQLNRKLRVVSTGRFPGLGWLILDTGGHAMGKKVVDNQRRQFEMTGWPKELMYEAP